MTLIHQEKLKAIQFIRPNAQFVLTGLDINWLDKTQTQPTEEEIAQGWSDYQAKAAADKVTSEAKRSAALAKLEALGLNEDDLKALGL